MNATLPLQIRRQIARELRDAIEWIDVKDPQKKSERMQGARYAYRVCIKRIRQIGYQTGGPR